MGDFRSKLRRAHLRKRERGWRSSGQVYKGQITGVHTDHDRIGISSHAGDTDLELGHPYVSYNSWIRAVPEAGSPILVAAREDTGGASHLGYVSELAPTRAKEYEGRNSLWRRMNQGEMDICSIGAASTYWGRRGNNEMRGGVVRGGLYHDRLEAYWKAPLHRWDMHEKSALIPLLSYGADEMRLGVVKRPHPVFPLSQEIYIPTVNIDGPTYAKEWLVALNKMIYHREGDVIDDVGAPEISVNTGSPLRAAHKWRTEQIVTSTDFEVDILGNVSWSLAPEALIGFQITIPTADFSVVAAKIITLQAGTNFQVTASTLASIDAPQIKLGSAATSQLVKGTEFIAALTTFLDVVAAQTTATTPANTMAAVIATGTAATVLIPLLTSYLSQVSKTV